MPQYGIADRFARNERYVVLEEPIRPDRECPICGATFRPQSWNHRHCKESCKREAQRRRDARRDHH